jgi:hypothetical protein
MRDLPDDLRLKRIIPLREAADLCGVSEDTLRRNHADKCIQVSPRRLGMRLGDALMLPSAEAGEKSVA